MCVYVEKRWLYPHYKCSAMNIYTTFNTFFLVLFRCKIKYCFIEMRLPKKTDLFPSLQGNISPYVHVYFLLVLQYSLKDCYVNLSVAVNNLCFNMT